jgi:hypothetical protein
MPIDPFQLKETIDTVIGNMPHPDAPELRVKDYRAHENAAAMMKNPDDVQPQDVVDMYHMLKTAGMSAADFEDTWQVARPVANQLLDRDPRPQELVKFVGATPSDIHDFYSGHPMPGHEEVKAGDFLRYHHAATPIAQMTVGRKPLPNEVARFASAGYDAESMFNHYNNKAQP